MNAFYTELSQPANKVGSPMSESDAALGRDREVSVVSPLDVLTERLKKAAGMRFTLREEVQRRYYPTPVVPHEKRGDRSWRRGVMVKSQ